MQRGVVIPDPVPLLDSWSSDSSSVVVPKADVVDRLLDLRNVVDERHARLVDAVLAGVPGVTTVPGEWWRAQLARLRAEFSAAPIEPSEATLTNTAPVSGDAEPSRWRRRRRGDAEPSR
ncbi:MAG: hypothetical protein AAF081_09280 [Actinomycetota bacterium]